ncbi:hypothetical protein [Oscillatoria sp. FACHB-1406]|uniref:hypothetical protein n=1 Tax=Oscillatoria sp. FACHB-1406 TaxID=2692846 RepID=UPI0016852298|nr:hypothetical protein [Oscillatoria sp. FACHB-1406]MBD2577973.1 hypothetical protein [Oscillatoria sp. FACHB-1406]
MQDKQKVTVYLPPGIHRQLKIRAAVDAESMSSMVERAIQFYLQNPEVVEEAEPAHGRTHRVYACPECHSPIIERDGELISLKNQPGVLSEEVQPPKVREETVSASSDASEELVPLLTS